MIVDRVREEVRAGGLLDRDGAVVAMLSGGRDSVCLLDVAVGLRGPDAVRALHVNYGLRGEESAEDERHCARLCHRLGVELVLHQAPPANGSAGNLLAWARDVRYAAAMSLARDLDAAPAAEGGETLVASGHTASDQVETILYRLAASPGRRALLGMSPREERLVRPLLGVSRAETAAYCRARDLPWREDSSNDSERFARARVRHGLAVSLAAVHPAAEANVLRTARLLREETELLESLVDDELDGAQEIALARFELLPAALQRLIVVRLAERATGRYVPQAGERVAEILELARRIEAGSLRRAELHVGGLAGAVLEGGTLRMVELPPRE